MFNEGGIMENKNGFYELTSPQKSIFITEQFYKGSPVNNVCGTAIMENELDFTILQKAIGIVIQNNDSFNMRLLLQNNQMKQYLSEYIPATIAIIDLSSKEELVCLEKKMTSRVFDVLKDILFEFKIFRFPDHTGGFVINIHHLFTDSWSLGLIGREVVRAYSCLIQHKDFEKNDAFSYLNYIDSEKDYIASDKFIKDKEYWSNIYHTIPESATLPGSVTLPVSTTSSCIANREMFMISKEKLACINAFCKENSISIFNFFMAIYSIYLGRISGLDDFVIGTPILNRTNFKEKNTTGMFINVVPFRVTLQEAISFKSFVTTIAKDSIAMLRHQRYSYQHILEDLRQKDYSLRSLYSIILSYQITKANIEEGLSYQTQWDFNGTTIDDMDIHLFDLNDSGDVTIAYDYKVSKYTKEDIQNIHLRILHIVNQILDFPEIPLKNIEVVTSKEKYQILYDFNSTDAEYPDKKTIVDLFEEQVNLTPNAIAVKINAEQLTYQELNQKANQLAHFLRTYGIRPNDVIALRLNKSLAMLVGILGIIKSGACYLPIDLSYPQERVDFMLSDSSAKLLLTDSFHREDLNVAIPQKTLDNNPEFMTYSTENLEIVNSPEDLIYIIYTSGSTGTPKGVMLMHRNIVRLIKNDHFLFDFNDKDVWTMFHSVAFDFSVWEMYACLLYGGKLILVPENIAKDPSKFLTLLREEKVTVLNQTPTYFYNLLDRELLAPDKNLAIRYIIFGGEALKPNLIKFWKDKYPVTKLINMYGITETTVHVTFRELDSKDLSLPYSNIGKPIPTLKVYIMDKNLRLLPYGVEGEMCVAGLGVCKGYLNRPELNDTRFVPNPYFPKELLYHSADSATLNTDGNLYYSGRIDTQVKIRGFRIELGEIETKLLNYPKVTKCVVLAKKNDDKDAHLIAYLVGDGKLNTRELKNYISRLVPEYMIPSYFVKLDKMPLTSNGKVDRKALLGMQLQIEKQHSYIPARNTFESTFIQILESNLHLDKVGIDDDIIELGADSLTLMRITIELLEKNYIVNIQDIYELKTIRNINDHMNHPEQIKNLSSEYLYYQFKEDSNNKKIPLHAVLLTGATGYLGIHILNDLLMNTDVTVYCLIRDKNNVDAKLRLIDKLRFYFGDSILNDMDGRIQVIKGNVSVLNFGLSEEEYSCLGNKIDAVIHSAALVSHYGDKELFHTINVVGTENIIAFCKQFSIYLNHISTTSIAANYVSDVTTMVEFNEHCLYVGQNYNDNIYIKSKFEAEFRVWEAINSGLIASVYRLGNITARLADGKFQENDNQNAFLNRIVAFTKLQKMPTMFANMKIDFSPVDVCSNIISTLMQYESSYFKVFHIANNHSFNVSELLDSLAVLGHPIMVVSDEEFNDFVSNMPMKNAVLGIINDITSSFTKTSSNVLLSTAFTTTYMQDFNLSWPKSDLEYIQKFLNKYVNGGTI